jgi:hypothetical protein
MTVLAGVPVFAAAREMTENLAGLTPNSSAATLGVPQYRRRYRRRRFYVIRRRHFRRRHYRRLYVIRPRRRRIYY